MVERGSRRRGSLRHHALRRRAHLEQAADEGGLAARDWKAGGTQFFFELGQLEKFEGFALGGAEAERGPREHRQTQRQQRRRG